MTEDVKDMPMNEFIEWKKNWNRSGEMEQRVNGIDYSGKIVLAYNN